MSEPTSGRPCRYCIANWHGMSARTGGTPIDPEPSDCEFDHRDDPRVYALAAEMCRAMQPEITDERIGWYLADANDVVDGFDPAPERWRVRRLPDGAHDGERGIEIRLSINGVTYVGLEGGKDCRGTVMPLATLREQEREANAP